MGYLLPTLQDHEKRRVASHTKITRRIGIPAKGVAVDDLRPFESAPHRTSSIHLRKANLREHRQHGKEDDAAILHTLDQRFLVVDVARLRTDIENTLSSGAVLTAGLVLQYSRDGAGSQSVYTLQCCKARFVLRCLDGVGLGPRSAPSNLGHLMQLRLHLHLL